MDMKKLYLSDTDKKIAGVCGGIGETFGIDPTVVRLLVVLLAISTAVIPTVIAYCIAWIIIPHKPA